MNRGFFSRRALAADRHRGRPILAVMFVLVAAPGIAGDDPLFSSPGITNVAIRAPISKLERGGRRAGPVAGTFQIENGEPLAVTFDVYGISRLRECELPSLVVALEDHTSNFGIAIGGHRSLRLVSPCRLKGDSDRHIVIEQLVYAAYASVTDIALRTRLARIRFRDTSANGAETTRYGFFVEDIDDVAARLGRSWEQRQPQTLTELDPARLTLMTLFQFMIGNTDWSAVRGPESELCCHNVAVLWGENMPAGLVLPFDFDQSGVVNAPYAVPPRDLGIRTVQQRTYRGFCEQNGYLEAAIAQLNHARPEIEKLFADSDLPYPKDRVRAFRYIEGSYEIVNDPKKLQRQILSACR